ncbi:carboxymuconolactone decarboxylase family protein [Chelatococcus sp. SYSU_G07232]|uniref:Carboxymuconolactone decarboxylase family protein n=1 Tax=Chelatococcus albus TaxID=3047466 RepID=A0ABT7AK82_9HYPH|nr:carboxymuconolactone decarboxylase family protein [Chelatococcus sp. SYSU_G07232]MDJ1159520.1 carboxymuconolactone decarboxylase family protein [Chelatococcus sp. SYSU_G07232]
MQARLNAYEVAPEIVQQAAALSEAINAVGLEPSLLELVKLRASQINGCAHCLHMHARDARRAGESEMRIHLLPAWRETLVFTGRERAALAWTEALTEVARKGAPDHLYEDLKAHFTDREIVALNSAVAMINFWNRSAIGLGYVPPVTRERLAEQAA